MLSVCERASGNASVMMISSANPFYQIIVSALTHNTEEIARLLKIAHIMLQAERY
jgi:hypothetical protein